jgi:hypothetical protein
MVIIGLLMRLTSTGLRHKYFTIDVTQSSIACDYDGKDCQRWLSQPAATMAMTLTETNFTYYGSCRLPEPKLQV